MTETTVEEAKAITTTEVLNFLNQLDIDLNEKCNGLETRNDFKILVWVKLRVLRYIFQSPQGQHLDDLERFAIGAMRHEGFSVRDIAFSVDRSISTVEEFIKTL